LYQEAEEAWQKGRLKSAFRLFLAAAKAGSDAARATDGFFHDDGIGVKADKDAALHWYRLAYRGGSDTAANNIGVIWRDKGKVDRALVWFRRAVRLGDGDANLQIAKIYLDVKPDPRKAVRYLKSACKAKFITGGSKDEARRLLREAEEKISRG
jgi:TPR repeat protein